MDQIPQILYSVSVIIAAIQGLYASPNLTPSVKAQLDQMMVVATQIQSTALKQEDNIGGPSIIPPTSEQPPTDTYQANLAPPTNEQINSNCENEHQNIQNQIDAINNTPYIYLPVSKHGVMEHNKEVATRQAQLKILTERDASEQANCQNIISTNSSQ